MAVDARTRRHERLEVRRRRRRCGGPARHDARALLQPDPDRPRAARGGRRSSGGARGRHSAAADLGDRVGRGRICRAGRGPAVGRAQRRAVRADVRRAEGAAGADPGRFRVDSRRHRRRPHHRRIGEAGRGLPRPFGRRRHRGLVPVRAGASCSCWSGPKACSARRSSAASDPPTPCSIAKQASSRPTYDADRRSFRFARTGSASR